MLFGRRTWEDFITAWAGLSRRQPVHHAYERDHQVRRLKDPEDAGAGQNSILLRGDAAQMVAELKAESGGDLGIIGSASLVRSLHAAGLIDRYTLVICPLTLVAARGCSRAPPPLTEFELTGSVVTTKGVIIAQYARL